MTDGFFVYGGWPWRIVALLSLVASIVSPFVVPAVALTLVPRARPALRVVAGVVAAPLGLVLGVSLFVFGACYGPSPGEAPLARVGYQRAAPVIQALDEYHARYGSYPRVLSYLVPELLPAMEMPKDTGAVPVEVHLAPTEYRISFRYFGPGSNTCIFGSRERKWQCAGAF